MNARHTTDMPISTLSRKYCCIQCHTMVTFGDKDNIQCPDCNSPIFYKKNHKTKFIIQTD